jgi:uncharacterized iron-regulated membrane protein
MFDLNINIVFNSSHALTDLPGDFEMENDLLAAGHDVHGRLAKIFGMMLVCGVAIGCFWFLCVAVPAGAIWK